MGAEELDIDTRRARAVAGTCDAASTTARGLAADVRSTLASAWLPTHAATLLDEIEHELGALSTFVDGVATRVEFADRFDGAQYGTTWYQAMRREWVDAESELWESLNDDVGATAMGFGSFTLAESMVDIPYWQWRDGLLPPGCEAFGSGRYYGGGGAVRGPDGRLYPLVIPHLVTDDGHYTIDANPSSDKPSVASLGGADPGWAMVGYHTGVERFSQEPGAAWSAIIGLAVASGLPFSPGVDDANLHGIRMSPGSRAIFAGSLPATPPSGSQPSGPVPPIDPKIWLVVDGKPGQYSIADLPEQSRTVRRAAERAGVDHGAPASAAMADNVLTLVAGAGNGYVAARDLDNGNHRAYEVIFEENDDGRVRARLQTFSLEAGDDGPALNAWHVSLGDDGELRQSPVSYQVGGASVISGDAVQSSNPLDPEFETVIPNPQFRGVEE